MDYMEVTIKPEGSDNFAVAQFQLWLPPDIKNLKGTIVLTAPSNGDGRGMVEELDWQAFAIKNKCALIGCYFRDKVQSHVEEYANASKGSGHALLEALRQFECKCFVGNRDVVPIGELALPLANLYLYGFSAGGEFNYEFACWAPELVKAFVVNKGGFYYTALAPVETRRIPAMWHIGSQDAHFRQAILKGLYRMNQAAGNCEWVALVEDVAHSEGHSEMESMRFFEGVLNGTN